MSAREGFLDAIRSEPEESAHRLIFADWLEEHGTTELDAIRAELIRAQIEREQADPDALEFWKARARERIALGVWGIELAEGIWEQSEDCRFRRGFVEAIALPVEAFLARGEALRRVAPIQAVALAGGAEALTAEALAPYAGLRLWNVYWQIESREHQRELAEKLRPRVLDINPQSVSLARAGLEAGWPLRHLGLGTVRLPRPNSLLEATLSFSAEDVAELFREPMSESLRSLDLRGVQMGWAEWEALFGRAFIRELDRLAMWAAPMDGNMLAFLSRQENLSGLRSLWLGGTPGPGSLQPGEYLRGLRELIVQGDDWLVSHVWSGGSGLSFPELMTLRHEFVREVRGVADWLCVPGAWPNLRVLEFRRWQADYAEVVPRLLESPVVPGLRRLELPVLPERGFSRAGGPLRLAELSLTATDLSTSLAAVSRSEVLPELVSLEIARARLDRPEDLEPLLDRSRFPHLMRIEIGGLRLNSSWQERFEERFGPGVSVSESTLTVFTVHDRVLEARL